MNDAEDFEVNAGDQMPYFIVEDQSIYDRLRQPVFHLSVAAAPRSSAA